MRALRRVLQQMEPVCDLAKHHSVQHMLGDILESTRKVVCGDGDIVERAHDDARLLSSL